MSKVIDFPPQLRAVSTDPEPAKVPALVLMLPEPVRFVPVEWCDACGLAHPQDLHDVDGGPDIPA
jgi:hypothetical protein